MTASLIPFPGKGYTLSPEEAKIAAESVLATSIEQRRERSAELNLEDPEQLLWICTSLWRLGEIEPAKAHREAEFFYGFLESPKRQIGIFDEKDYYLGEFALIAGGCSRILSKRVQAKEWFDVAETHFVLAHNASAHVARLAYQRLALKLEEREFESVLHLAPRWADCFARLDLPEDALKCRFLEAAALKETGRLEEVKRSFQEIKLEAGKRRFDRLMGMASESLFQVHAFLGEVSEAVTEAREAAVILRRLDNRVNLAKLQLGVGYLLRSQGNLAESVEAFRGAQQQFAEIEMHADVAATHLVLADILLDAAQPAQAEWEIRAALPIIDELKLVPEGIAAVSLLRDSLRRREIDRHALRSLNGYFEELGS